MIYTGRVWVLQEGRDKSLHEAKQLVQRRGAVVYTRRILRLFGPEAKSIRKAAMVSDVASNTFLSKEKKTPLTRESMPMADVRQCCAPLLSFGLFSVGQVERKTMRNAVKPGLKGGGEAGRACDPSSAMVSQQILTRLELFNPLGRSDVEGAREEAARPDCRAPHPDPRARL